MKRSASAVWKGGLKDGRGTISTQSGVLQDTQYSFSTRFEDGKGTNPEELLGAAHASCFAMALSLVCQITGQGKWSNFLAQWVPTWLVIGVYNKLVKLEGHDHADRANSH